MLQHLCIISKFFYDNNEINFCQVLFDANNDSTIKNICKVKVKSFGIFATKLLSKKISAQKKQKSSVWTKLLRKREYSLLRLKNFF